MLTDYLRYAVRRTGREMGPFQEECVGASGWQNIGTAYVNALPQIPQQQGVAEMLSFERRFPGLRGLRAFGRPLMVPHRCHYDAEERTVTLEFRVPRSDVPDVSAFFAYGADRIRTCRECERVFPASRRDRPRCDECTGLGSRWTPPITKANMRWLSNRLAQHVHRGHRTHAECKALLRKAKRDAVVKRMGGRAWREKWDKRTRRRPGRPLKDASPPFVETQAERAHWQACVAAASPDALAAAYIPDGRRHRRHAAQKTVAPFRCRHCGPASPMFVNKEHVARHYIRVHAKGY